MITIALTNGMLSLLKESADDSHILCRHVVTAHTFCGHMLIAHTFCGHVLIAHTFCGGRLCG